MQGLVLDANSFLGRRLVAALAQDGHAVRVPSGDWRDKRTLAAALETCDVCFHLLPTAPPDRDSAVDLLRDVAPTVQLLQMCVESRVRKIVFASAADAIYGPASPLPTPETALPSPISGNGVHALAIENYLGLFTRTRGLGSVSLRLGCLYGEHQRPPASQGRLAAILAAALHGEAIEIDGDGTKVHDYLYVGDAASALIKAASYAGADAVFNVGSGVGRSTNEVVDAIEDVMGQRLARRYRATGSIDASRSILAIDRAARDLGWSPSVAFSEGLVRTYRWMRVATGTR